MEEVFRPVPGWANYEVSNLGSVRRRKRIRGRGFADGWVGCKLFQAGDGYRCAHFWDGKRSVSRYVHRLVLEAFVGPCPAGHYARHILNNDRTDNRLVNLAWGTPIQNMEDKKRHGTHRSGDRVTHAKLKVADVLEMRRLRREGILRGDIAKRFGVSDTHVSKVIGAKGMWADVAVSEDERRALIDAAYKASGLKRAKLTAADIEEIRSQREANVSRVELARRFGVSAATVTRISMGTYRRRYFA
jgi:hypothetical protein